jgi:hypothetical protein
MTEKTNDRARFTEMRARALTNVLLTSRECLGVQELTATDSGIAYLVTIASEKPGTRQFAVALRAAYSPMTVENANKVLGPSLQSMARYEPFPYPVVLFYFTMMDSQGWYTWVMEPIEQTDGMLNLETRETPNCQPLDESALDDVIECVDRWYDFYVKQTAAGKAVRPAHTSSDIGGKPVKNKVVITELDSVLFDYSEKLLQTREQLTAAQHCSSYIAKTYVTPLPTVMGLWDRVEDEKGRAVITLTLTDKLTRKSATARFSPKDIQNPVAVYHRFQGLIGDIIHPG